MRFDIRLILGAALLSGSLQLQAQDLDLEYDTEWQTDFRGNYNWLNLLRLSASLAVNDNLSLECATISIANSAGERLVDDLQGYSNIEEDNLPLAIAVLGAEYRFGRSTLFAGVRNVNEDYFTSPLTSLFLNSSCGIFPTLSANCEIANYPLASLCLHYKAQWKKVAWQASVYNGLGYKRIAGHGNVFRFSPSRDGVFSITSAEYIDNGSNYSMGCAVHYGVHNSDEVFGSEAPYQAPQTKKSLSAAYWLNIEQRITDASAVMLQASAATANTDCRYYFGAGATHTVGIACFGLFGDYAHFRDCDEVATELTCRLDLTPALSVQPTIEVIHIGGCTNVVGLARLKISI